MKKYKGLLLAFTIILSWISCLIFLFTVDLSKHIGLILPGFLAQTFLYTGIFITAHDAIHNSILPGRPKFNQAIGAFCLFVYALFPYNKVREKHFSHHRYSGSEKDPDYHDGIHKGFWSWYYRFFSTYITFLQILGMAIIFQVLLHLVSVPLANLLLFWVAPSLVSTAQLFYFGTYLPHREPEGGYDNPHHAQSNDYSVLLSFFTCYHFGYHWEHHEYPGTPWWDLPKKRALHLRTNH